MFLGRLYCIRNGYILPSVTDRASPLTPAVLHILLAVSETHRHGYAIMKQVQADARGAVTIGPGTLYGSLNRMLKAGLVTEVAPPDGEDERRIYYGITAAGRQALAAELDRYRRVVAVSAALQPAPEG